MSIYEKYEKLITLKAELESLTKAFITKITTQLDYYLQKNKLTQKDN